MPEERWAAIPGYEGRYEVSDAGRVRSLRRNRVLRQRLNQGYPTVSLGGGRGNRRTSSIHRLVMLAFVGPKPFDKAEIRHLNGIKADVRLANLRYGTRSENEFDKRRLGELPALSTHCGNGHEFDEENTYVRPDGRGRVCRACHRDFQSRYELRRAVAS